jgi:hypothetical protein
MEFSLPCLHSKRHCVTKVTKFVSCTQLEESNQNITSKFRGHNAVCERCTDNPATPSVCQQSSYDLTANKENEILGSYYFLRRYYR